MSLIPTAVDQSAGRPGVLKDPDRPVPADLLMVLAQVGDPRARRGVRHRVVTIWGAPYARCWSERGPTPRSLSGVALSV